MLELVISGPGTARRAARRPEKAHESGVESDSRGELPEEGTLRAALPLYPVSNTCDRSENSRHGTENCCQADGQGASTMSRVTTTRKR